MQCQIWGVRLKSSRLFVIPRHCGAFNGSRGRAAYAQPCLLIQSWTLPDPRLGIFKSRLSLAAKNPHRSALAAKREQVGYISVTPPTTSYVWLYISNHSPLHPHESTFIVFARFSFTFVLSLFLSLASISFFIHPDGQYHEICAGWAVLPQWRPRRNSFQPDNGTTTAEGGPPAIIRQDSSRRKWWWPFTQLVRHDV